MMRAAALCWALLSAGSCAAVAPNLPADRSFAEAAVAEAERTGVAGGRAAELLAAAKDELDYAAQIPNQAARADRLYLRAQADAELAVLLATGARDRLVARRTETSRQRPSSSRETP